METKILSEKLKDEAKSLGLCDEWFADWKKDCSLDELCKKYVLGIDFCIENRFPSNDIIEKEFDLIRRKYNIFVNEEVRLKNKNGSWAIILGESNADIHLNEYGILEAYLCDNTTAKVRMDDNSKCFITLLDDAKVDISTSKYTRLHIYTNHPENINYVKADGTVIIKPTIFKNR